MASEAHHEEQLEAELAAGAKAIESVLEHIDRMGCGGMTCRVPHGGRVWVIEVRRDGVLPLNPHIELKPV